MFLRQGLFCVICLFLAFPHLAPTRMQEFSLISPKLAESSPCFLGRRDCGLTPEILRAAPTCLSGIELVNKETPQDGEKTGYEEDYGKIEAVRASDDRRALAVC